jgi:hypothetical protein
VEHVQDACMSFPSTSKPDPRAISLGFLLLAACGDDPSAEGTTGDAEMTSTGSTGGSTTDVADTSATAGTSDPTTSDSTTSDPADTTAAEETTSGDDTTDDVVEIAIRRLNEGQDLTEFEAARDAFVALLTMQPGVGTDREFESFLDYSVFTPPTPPVFIGMTQYDSMADFMAAGDAVGASAEAGAFFSTFTPELFTILVPLEAGGAVDLAGVAARSEQVLEVAVRDLSGYPAFDPIDYADKRDAFLALLAEQPGFVAEYQWTSALDPNLAVGMTVYESAGAFATLSQDASFLGATEVTEFLETYPPMGGHVSSVVK